MRARVADGTINLVFSSPPYLGQRRAQIEGEIGDEPTEVYIRRIGEIADECWRVLGPDGLMIVDLGDQYGGPNKGGDELLVNDKVRHLLSPLGEPTYGTRKEPMLLPPLIAFEIKRRKPWVLRSEIIWRSSHPKPESVRDRPAMIHHRLYMFAKRPIHYGTRSTAGGTCSRSWSCVTIRSPTRRANATGTRPRSRWIWPAGCSARRRRRAEPYWTCARGWGRPPAQPRSWG